MSIPEAVVLCVGIVSWSALMAYIVRHSGPSQPVPPRAPDRRPWWTITPAEDDRRDP